MIEVINNKIISIDDNANMTVIEDESLQTLVNNIKEHVIKDNITCDQTGECEDIYYYLIEKIYTMPDYPKWNDVPFKEKPKAKLLIALNKFLYDKLNKRTE